MFVEGPKPQVTWGVWRLQKAALDDAVWFVRDSGKDT